MRKRLLGAALLTSFCLLSGCSGYKEVSVSLPETTEGQTRPVIEIEAEAPAEENQEQQRVLRDGMLPSYLTGEWMDAEKAERRPLAIMISNDKAALPHYGINHAGVIYEAPVEGTMNRFMAFFDDYDELERIGSVRSCRPYYTYFAREFEAVCAHFGQNTFAVSYLEQMDHLDGIQGKGASAFYRTKDRRSPHNAYASGAGVREAIAASGYEAGYPDTYSGHYRFAAEGHEQTLPEGFGAVYVRPGYPLNDPWFEYNPEDGLYYRFQYGGPHEGDEGQLAVRNIIFQYCPWSYYSPTEYLYFDVLTPGGGYYFTEGRGEVITWKKDSEFGVTRYYDQDGQEILLNPGKTWVCILKADWMDKAEYYGKQTE